MITAKPDITKIKNENIDFIIMGCDGIWEIKTNENMVAWVQSRINTKKFESICEELLDELVSKDSGNQYGMDNMSAILIKFAKKWNLADSMWISLSYLIQFNLSFKIKYINFKNNYWFKFLILILRMIIMVIVIFGAKGRMDSLCEGNLLIWEEIEG